jgi:hypothetical protein
VVAVVALQQVEGIRLLQLLEEQLRQPAGLGLRQQQEQRQQPILLGLQQLGWLVVVALQQLELANLLQLLVEVK